MAQKEGYTPVVEWVHGKTSAWVRFNGESYFVPAACVRDLVRRLSKAEGK